MTTKQISRLVVLVAVVLPLILRELLAALTAIVVLLARRNEVHVVNYNLDLAAALSVALIALVVIVIWMFAYAKKMRKK